MKIKIFKIWVISSVLVYLLFKQVSALLIRIFLPKTKYTSWKNREVILWAKILLDKLYIRCEVQNAEVLNQLDHSRSIFLVPNHQSYADIPLLLYSTQKMYGFIAKYQLQYIPFLGHWMREIGCQFINRTRYLASLRNLKELEQMGKPCRLVIFPEGTRSKTGNLNPFKSGVLKIAWSMNALIVPVYLWGPRKAWEDRKNWAKEVDCRVKFSEVIDTKELKKHQSFEEFFMELESQFLKNYSAN